MNIVKRIVDSAIGTMPKSSSSAFIETETSRVFSQLDDLAKLIRMDEMKPIRLVENESVNTDFDKFFNELQWYLYTLASNYTVSENKYTEISDGLLSTSTYTNSALAQTYAFTKSEVDKITLLGKDYADANYYNFSVEPNWKYDGITADVNARKLTLTPASENDVQSTISGVDAQSYMLSPFTMVAKTDGTASVIYKLSSPFNTLTIRSNAPAGSGILLTKITAVKNGISTVVGPEKPVELYSAYNSKIFLPYTDADYVILQFTQKYTTSYLDGNAVIRYAPIILKSVSFKLVAYQTSGTATFTVNDSKNLHTLYVRRYVGSGDVTANINTGSSSMMVVVSDVSSSNVNSINAFTVSINMFTTDKYQTPIVKDIAIVGR